MLHGADGAAGGVKDVQCPSDLQLSRLSAAECVAVGDQLDQAILSSLQSIDATFIQSTRVVTGTLIPSIEAYGRNSKQIWDSVKLWKAFFESAAGIRLVPDGQNDDEDEDYRLQAPGHDVPYSDDGDATELASTDAGDRTATLEDVQQQQQQQRKISHHSNNVASKKKSKRVSTTPPTSDDDEAFNDHAGRDHEFIVPPIKPGKSADGRDPGWADDASPFEQLRNDMQKVRLDTSYSTSISYQAPAFAPSSVAAVAKKQQHRSDEGEAVAQRQAQQYQTRLRDLSMDSPDFERPALQTMSFQHPRERLTQQYNQAPLPDQRDKGKGRASPDESSAASVQDTPGGMSTFSDLSSLDGASTAGSSARPEPIRRKSSSNQNALLQKVLLKNLVGKDGRPNLSTPATKRLSKSVVKAQAEHEGEGFLPEDLPKHWNGIADLTKASLASFESPQKSAARRSSRKAQSSHRSERGNGRQEDRKEPEEPRYGIPNSTSSDSLFDNSIFRDGTGVAGDSYIQPPPFSAYKSRLSRTPAKEAARLITRDVLQQASLREGGSWQDAEADSPALNPPSVVKNWATRGYTAAMPPGSVGKQSSTHLEPGQQNLSMQRSHALVPLAEGEDSFEAEFEDEEALAPPPQPNFGHLADEHDEDAGAQRDNVDDWEDSFEDGHSRDEGDDNSGFDEVEVPMNDVVGNEGESFASDGSRSFDDETLFGAKKGRPSHGAAGGGFGMQPDGLRQYGDSLDPRQAEAFRLRSQNDMVTLHGGNLLESQPFEASPLAGRDARYGL